MIRRPTLKAVFVTVSAICPGAAAHAGSGFLGPLPGVTGNDTGGIIQWTPEIRYTYRAIAANYCASWNKVSRITSVHSWYGNYVGFRCMFPRGYDPVKIAAYGYDPRVIVRAKY